MSNHQKRLSAPDSWPVERKTEKFTVKAQGPHGDDGVPLVVLLRDVLGYVASTKEASYAVDAGSVLVNGSSVSDPRRPIGMFDILSFPERGEHYRVFPDEGGRLGLTPIDADAAGSRLGKVVDKTVVSGGKTQLNLHDGANLLVDGHEIAAGDSVVVDNEDGTIVAHFAYEKGALVTAVDGSHAGEIGRLDAVEETPGSSPNTVSVETDDGGFETVEAYVVVIDENFTGGEAAADAAEPDVVEEAGSTEVDGESEEAESEEAESEEVESEEVESEAAESEEVESEEVESEEDADAGEAEESDEGAEESDEGAEETAASDEEADGDEGGEQ